VSHLNAPEPAPDKPAPQRRAPRIPTAPPEPLAHEPTFIAPTPDETTIAKPRPQPPAADESDWPPATPGRASGVASDDVLQQPLWEALQEMENGNGEDAGEDELLPEAIALVRSLNKASTSLLQRRFRIGYTRAARLMDALEDGGIIGPPTGTSKAREVFAADGSVTTAADDAAEPPGDGA
jgi:S-DNA-T family DNA segregation ATPase FtsK/SpoIIIE